MKPARWIKTDGTVIEVTPKNGKNFEIDEIYAFIQTDPKINPDPMFQELPMKSKGMILICEENAMMLNLPKNDTATIECALDALMSPEGMLGDILICRPDQLE